MEELREDRNDICPRCTRCGGFQVELPSLADKLECIVMARHNLGNPRPQRYIGVFAAFEIGCEEEMRDGRVEGRPRLFNHGRAGRTREILNNLSTENRLPEPRRPVDPQQLWPGGKLRLEPAPKHGSVEDPIARTGKSFLQGVAVPFVWRTVKPEVDFAPYLGF